MGRVEEVVLERLVFAMAALRWCADELELSEVREVVSWPVPEEVDLMGEDVCWCPPEDCCAWLLYGVLLFTAALELNWADCEGLATLAEW